MSEACKQIFWLNNGNAWIEGKVCFFDTLGENTYFGLNKDLIYHSIELA